MEDVDSHGDYYGQVDSEGLKHGIGRSQNQKGSIYEGEWKNNRHNGYGREI